MSEEKTETIETPEEEPKVNDVVGDNVALLKSKIIGLESVVVDLTEKLEAISTKYEQAKEFVDDNAKTDLISYIAPRYAMSEKLLVLKTKDELMAIKAIIDKVAPQVFRSSTKMDTRKPSQNALLESTFDRAHAKRMEGKN